MDPPTTPPQHFRLRDKAAKVSTLRLAPVPTLYGMRVVYRQLCWAR